MGKKQVAWPFPAAETGEAESCEVRVVSLASRLRTPQLRPPQLRPRPSGASGLAPPLAPPHFLHAPPRPSPCLPRPSSPYAGPVPLRDPVESPALLTFSALGGG